MFIVETGEGLPNSTSYVDVDYADEYFLLFGTNPKWADLKLEEKERELMVGTAYVDRKYGPTLGGKPLKADQALEFPRIGLKDRYGRPITGVPKNIKQATCEYALINASGGLYPNSSQIDENIKSKTVKVGPITTSTSFVEGRRTYTYYNHPYPDSLISPFVNPGLSGVGKQ